MRIVDARTMQAPPALAAAPPAVLLPAAPTPAPAPAPPPAAKAPPPPLSARLLRFAADQHLPLGLALFSLLGFVFPAPGRALAATPLNTLSLVGIFFLSGLGLKTDEMRAAFAAVPAYAFGFASILAISPCLAFAIASPAFDFLGPAEFKYGLALFAAMPTTVSSGLVMTAEAGGNTALAVLFSVGTNLAGIVTVPLFLAAFMRPPGGADAGGGGGGGDGGGGGGGGGSGIDPGAMILNLGLVILLPLAAGKALREGSRRARDFAAAQKQRLKMLSSALLISVPWMSMSSASDDIGRAAPANILALTLLGVLLHALLLGFNNGACLLLRRAGLRIALAERKAVVVNCSQKTLNTAVSVIAFLPAALGDKGLITVPCILAHFAQIIMDGFVVARWKHVTTEDAGDGGASPAAEEVAAAAPPAPPAPPAPAAAPDDVEAWGATGRVLARGEGDLEAAR